LTLDLEHNIIKLEIIVKTNIMVQANKRQLVIITIYILAVGAVLIGLLYFAKNDLNLERFCQRTLGTKIQQVCRAKNKIPKVIEDTAVQSGDNVAIAINLAALLDPSLKLKNVFTGEQLNDVSLKNSQICFVVYPVLNLKYMKAPSEEAYNSFYKEYQTKIILSGANIQKTTIGVNSVCTEVTDLTKLKEAIIFIKIPAKDYLFLATQDTFTYGVKIKMVPQPLLGKINTTADLQYYKEIVPIYLFNEAIQLGK